MISALIFDLDNCLASAAEPGQKLLADAFDAIKRVNDGRLSEEELQAAFADCWFHSLDWVAWRHGFSPPMLQAAWDVLRKKEVGRPMQGYGDLEVLPMLDATLFLVTTGFRLLQESKIRALGIAHLFAAVEIDAIDEPDRKGKQKIFAELRRRHELATHEVLVVGDNPESELAAGANLGMKTVQTLRPGVTHSELADFHVRNLQELAVLVAGFRAGA